jgi:hypothetical protein
LAGYRELPNRTVTAYFGKNIVIRFEFDRAGWRRIALSPELRRATTDIVRNRAMPYAKSISPYDERNRTRPHYRDQFMVVQGFAEINDLRRVATRLFNVSDHATEVEFLNSGRKGGPLRRTISYLIHESVIEHLLKNHERAQKAKPFDKEAHPRGARGRFVPRRSAVKPDPAEERVYERNRRLTESNDPDFIAWKAEMRRRNQRPL